MIDRANAIFGYGRWSATVIGTAAFHPTAAAGRGRGFYTVTVRVEVDGALLHTESGVGVASDPSPETHALALVTAVDDALRRALAHFGPQLETAPRHVSPEDAAAALRDRVLTIAAAAGCDEAQARAWVLEHYGDELDALALGPLADAVGVLERGFARRQAERAA